jgi:hypothetical protein
MTCEPAEVDVAHRNIPKSWSFTVCAKQASSFQAKEPRMLDDPKLFFNLVTRDALLIFEGQAHLLEGPFSSREEAESAGEELMERISKEASETGDRVGEPVPMRSWHH